MEVFEESQAEDDNQMIMPGGIDLNSHQDIFNALFTKVMHFTKVYSSLDTLLDMYIGRAVVLKTHYSHGIVNCKSLVKVI